MGTNVNRHFQAIEGSTYRLKGVPTLLRYETEDPRLILLSILLSILVLLILLRILLRIPLLLILLVLVTRLRRGVERTSIHRMRRPLASLVSLTLVQATRIQAG